MEKLKTYLVGSIQDAKDGGTGWREKVGKKLEELGFTAQDPTKAECNHTLADSIEDQKIKLRNLKKRGAYKVFVEVMNKIIKADLVCVNNSRFIVLLYSTDKKHGGTHHEIIESNMKGIPIYYVYDGPKTDCNDWIFTLLENNKDYFNGGEFTNFKQLVEFIEDEYKDYIKDYGKFIKEEAKKAHEAAEREAKEDKDEKKEVVTSDKAEHK